MSAPAKVTTWIVDVPGAPQPLEVRAVTPSQVIALVAEALGRRVRLIPHHFGEVGEVWRIRASGSDVALAPMIYEDATQ